MAAAQGAGSSVAGPSGAPSSSSSSVPGLQGSSPAVAVWEWQDEFGRWRPYRGNVCSYIEQVLQAAQQKGRRSGSSLVSSIPLGHADAVLAPYVIDIPSLTQFRQDTGKGAPLLCCGAVPSWLPKEPQPRDPRTPPQKIPPPAAAPGSLASSRGGRGGLVFTAGLWPDFHFGLGSAEVAEDAPR